MQWKPLIILIVTEYSWAWRVIQSPEYIEGYHYGYNIYIPIESKYSIIVPGERERKMEIER